MSVETISLKRPELTISKLAQDYNNASAISEVIHEEYGYKDDPISIMGKLAQTVDYLFGAPVRSGLKGYSEGVDRGDFFPEFSGMRGALKSFAEWDPAKFTTGKDVAESFGISPMSFKEAAMKAGQPHEFMPDISPAGIGGLGVEAVADLTGLVPFDTLGTGTKYLDDVGDVANIGKKVYHGSPHKFDRFSMENVGTGEGAQVFGHGLYFSGDPNVAKQYAEFLGGDEKRFIPYKWYKMADNQKERGLIDEALMTWNDMDYGFHGYDRETALGSIDKMISQDWRTNKDVDFLKKLRNKIEGMEEFGKYQYKATIPHGKYIKWDQNLDEKAFSRIRKRFRKEVKEDLSAEFKDYSGKEIYESLVDYFGSQKKASEFLNRSGIKGIDYPAGTLSGIESKARNYVSFSDEGITIEDMKKLMLLGGAGLGASAVYQQSESK